MTSYDEAYQKEYYTLKNPRVKNIRSISVRNEGLNSRVERLNGTMRDREKVMRGLKKKDTPILKGYEIFHNYFRPHEGLKGKTPSQACGVEIEGENKWKTLIENASVRQW